MLLVKEDSFVYFFYMCISFISFFYFISLTRTFSTMFNRMDESRHPWFVPDLGEKEFCLFVCYKYIITIRVFFRCSLSPDVLVPSYVLFHLLSTTYLRLYCVSMIPLFIRINNFIVTVKNS